MSDHAISNARGWLASIREHAEKLRQAERAVDSDAADAAREEVEQAVLSVQVRGGWHNVGEADGSPAEFEVLLTTGGPALRIVGELDAYAQPEDADLQWQDWGTPWTSLPLDGGELHDVLIFARVFYYGEG